MSSSRKQLDKLKVQWVELRSEKGYKKFEKILRALSIPYKSFKGDLSKALNDILSEISDEEVQEMATENAGV